MMFGQRYLGLSALLAALLLPLTPSRAATYTFNPSTVTNNPNSAPYIAYTPGDFPTVALSIQDSAVQSGAFSISYSSGPVTFTGDTASLISFTIGNFVTLTPNSGYASTFNANLQFNPDGSILAGTLYYASDRFGIDLSGSGTAFGGTFVPSDLLYPGTVSGTFTSTPEPASLALLVTALTFACCYRRNLGRGSRRPMLPARRTPTSASAI